MAKGFVAIIATVAKNIANGIVNCICLLLLLVACAANPTVARNP
jgi:hypothetical protein